jgi:hypothetical protein
MSLRLVAGDFQRGGVRAALEREVLAIDHLARRALLGVDPCRWSAAGCSDPPRLRPCRPAAAAGSSDAVIPGQFHGRHSPRAGNRKASVEACGKMNGLWPSSFTGLHFRGQAELEELVGGVENVRAPVAERAVAEVVPRAPLAIHVSLVVFVAAPSPASVPVERVRDRLFRQEIRTFMPCQRRGLFMKAVILVTFLMMPLGPPRP